jgi:Domain of unknown function (DUF4845)
MRHSQRGVTFLGWIILLIPVAIIVFSIIRLFPIYENYFSVSKALSQVQSESKGAENTLTAEGLRVSLDKHFQVGYVEKPTAKDIDIHREGSHWVMIADYDETAPLFYNLSLLVEFHKQVDLE